MDSKTETGNDVHFAISRELDSTAALLVETGRLSYAARGGDTTIERALEFTDRGARCVNPSFCFAFRR